MNKNIRGISLLEVMVSSLLLSVGLLGFAALQLQSLRFTNDAYMHSQAEVLLYDMADRLRLNATIAGGNNYLLDYDDPQLDLDPDCAQESCTAAELAEFDIWWFQEEAARILIGGAPAIQRPDATQPRQLILSVRYFLQNSEVDGDGNSVARVAAIQVSL